MPAAESATTDAHVPQLPAHESPTSVHEPPREPSPKEISLEEEPSTSQTSKRPTESMSAEQVKEYWRRKLGDDYDIVLGIMEKPPSGGLGLSLEGTVDVVNGAELRPHHYIQRIHPDGPAGRCQKLRAGRQSFIRH